MERAREITHFLLRVVAGLLFLHHGAQKLFGWFGGIPPNGGPAPFWSQAGIAGFLEFFGGLLILVGLLTRPVAFVLAGEMAVAYFRFHQPRALLPIQNGGELAVLFCFLFLFFAAHGPGRFSLDALRARSKGLPKPRREALVH